MPANFILNLFLGESSKHTMATPNTTKAATTRLSKRQRLRGGRSLATPNISTHKSTTESVISLQVSIHA
jgi:hypothetical protein